MSESATPTFRNHLLRQLSPPDVAALLPAMEFVELGERTQLENPNRPIEYVYFIESGVSSVVARSGNQEIEVGLAGREGVVGSAALMGTTQTPNSVFMQVGGSAYRVPRAALIEAATAGAALARLLTVYNYTVLVQAQATALANGRAKLEDRLARWLLMVHDRIDGDRLNITHEFLSIMLGVRRPGVTVGLHLLEGQGLISSLRREILIRNRSGLIGFAAECYGLPEREYARLLGDFRAMKATAGS